MSDHGVSRSAARPYEDSSAATHSTRYGLILMARSCAGSVVEVWMLPCSTLYHMRDLKRNVYATEFMCLTKRNSLNPNIREAQLCISKCTSLTMSLTSWVMTGRARRSRRAINQHSSSSVGHNSSLPDAARSRQMEERWLGC